MSTIQAISIKGPLGILRGMFHRPDTDQPVPAIMLLHGFTGHHIEDHRLFVQMSNYLTKAGFAVLRFDFYGSGDSDGEFDEFTIQTELNDAVAGLNWLLAQPGIDAHRIGVVGLSFGGGVTALLAGCDPRVKAAVFWNAFSLPQDHFLEHTQFDLASDGGIIGGLRIGPDFARVLHQTDIIGTLRHYAGPGLVVHSTKDEALPRKESEAIKDALGDRGEMVLIEDADHTFKHPAWRSEVFEITTRWLLDHLPE